MIPDMIPEPFFLTPAAIAQPYELPPLPLWLTLGLAGAVTLVAALGLALS